MKELTLRRLEECTRWKGGCKKIPDPADDACNRDDAVPIVGEHRAIDCQLWLAMLRGAGRASAAPNPLARTPPSCQNGEMPPPFLVY